MRTPVIFLLTLFWTGLFTLAQQDYNNCSQALELCPGVSVSVDNIGANVTFCPGCEDDFTFCFTPDNSIWFQFTTNATGGDVQIDVSNLVFEAGANQDNELQATIIETAIPCNAGSYVAIGNCVSNATGNFSLNALGLPANTTYYVVIDGDNNGAGITTPAECSFDVVMSGSGVDRTSSAITISQSNTTICLNEFTTFTANLENCPDSTEYNWFVNGEFVAVTTDPVYHTSSLNDGDVVSVSNTCYAICPVTISADATPVSVYSFPVDAGEDISAASGEVVQLNGSTTSLNYSWSPAYLFSNPNVLDPMLSTDETITLTLSATENGCTLSDYVTITIAEALEIPNTFSPNADNTNDTWEIVGIESYPNSLLKIYDRWGQLILQTSGYSKEKAWDGTINGKNVSEGVYYYVLDLREEGTEIIKGYITLIR